MNIIAFECKYMKIFSNKEHFCKKIYIKPAEIGCAKTKKHTTEQFERVIFPDYWKFFIQNFKIQIEFSNFARNKDKRLWTQFGIKTIPYSQTFASRYHV